MNIKAEPPRNIMLGIVGEYSARDATNKIIKLVGGLVRFLVNPKCYRTWAWFHKMRALMTPNEKN